ncbi:MAG: CPBP family intramembrane metalloprotease [Planctomycetes bacterium]|nr:CPBP family intramembrane metalloprotease [Planctomycetota bacterium]
MPAATETATGRPSKWADDIPVAGGEAIWPLLAVWAVVIIVWRMLKTFLPHEDFQFWRVQLALVEQVLLIGVLYYLLYVRSDEGLVDGLHLHLRPIWHWFGGLGLGVAYFVTVEVLLLHVSLGKPMLGAGQTDVVKLLFVTVLYIVAAMVNELFYRGLIYPLVRRAIGVLGSVLVVTLWFALVRSAYAGGDWWRTGAVVGLSLILTLARVFSRGVAAPIGIHLGFGLSLCVSLWLPE